MEISQLGARAQEWIWMWVGMWVQASSGHGDICGCGWDVVMGGCAWMRSILCVVAGIPVRMSYYLMQCYVCQWN